MEIIRKDLHKVAIDLDIGYESYKRMKGDSQVLGVGNWGGGWCLSQFTLL